jgi:hypothetical protein
MAPPQKKVRSILVCHMCQCGVSSGWELFFVIHKRQRDVVGPKIFSFPVVVDVDGGWSVQWSACSRWWDLGWVLGGPCRFQQSGWWK